MKVTMNYKDQTTEVDVAKDATVSDIVERYGQDLRLPKNPIVKLLEISVEPTDKLEEDSVVRFLAAEVVYGAHQIDISDMVGKKVGEVRKFYGEALNLPEDEKIIVEVNGKKKKFSYHIKEGDRVEFVKKTGRKL